MKNKIPKLALILVSLIICVLSILYVLGNSCKYDFGRVDDIVTDDNYTYVLNDDDTKFTVLKINSDNVIESKVNFNRLQDDEYFIPQKLYLDNGTLYLSAYRKLLGENDKTYEVNKIDFGSGKSETVFTFDYDEFCVWSS